MLILLSEKLLQTKHILLHSLQLTRSRSSFCLIVFLRGCFLLVYRSDCPSFSRLSVHPIVPLYACVSPMCRCLSVCPSIKLSVGPSVYQAFCLSVHQASVCLSSYLFFCLSLSSCLSVYLSVCHSVKLSAYQSVFLSAQSNPLYLSLPSNRCPTVHL